MSNKRWIYTTTDGKKVLFGGDEVREYSENARGNTGVVTRVVLTDGREYLLPGSRFMMTEGFLADRSSGNNAGLAILVVLVATMLL